MKHLRKMARWVSARYYLKYAGPLTDVSHLRFQAVFMIGAAGSGKTYVGHRWLKYIPGGGSSGYTRKQLENSPLLQKTLLEKERGLSNLSFQNSLEEIRRQGVPLEIDPSGNARIPFRLGDDTGRKYLPRNEWEAALEPEVYQQVKDLEEVVFNTPVHEVPSYWRQVGADVYKEELAGYLEKRPGHVHQMSSDMTKAYFNAILETGDPMFVDGTGRNYAKMESQIRAAKSAGYRVSLVYVRVPLVVNQIRNATRPRSVNPNIVSSMWGTVRDNFLKLRSIADKSVVVDNRNDKEDIAKYEKNKAAINAFIAKSTRYSSLYELILEEAPGEARSRPWSQLLTTGIPRDPRREELRERFGPRYMD